MSGRRLLGSQSNESFFVCGKRCGVPESVAGDCPICGQSLIELAAPAARHSRGWWWGAFRTFLPLLIIVAGGAAVIGMLGIAQRAGWLVSATSDSAGGMEKEHADRYICPMMCTPPQAQPGRCPVCAMELVPAAAGTSASGDTSIEISPAARRVANIQTAPAQEISLQRTIHTIGELAFDESKMATISSYVDGRIEKLYADYTGLRVAPGDRLALVYSPELYSAQVELLESRAGLRSTSIHRSERVEKTQQMLYDGARAKLAELGVTESQIQALEQEDHADSRVTLFAPMQGTIIERLAVDGQYVKSGQPIYRLVDLSRVWLVLELFPEDAAALRFAMKVEARLQSMPKETFDGRIAFIDPVVDPKQRTVKVRVVIPNDQGLLRVGDYARATVRVDVGPPGQRIYDPELAGMWISPRYPNVVSDQPGVCPECQLPLVETAQWGYAATPVEQHKSIVVPRSAVLLAGDHSVVYVETRPGFFEMRSVSVGTITEQQAEILDGLEAGEDVAVSGNFLIDSQMQLVGNPSVIDPRQAKAAKTKQK